MSIITILARERGEDPSECNTEVYKGYHFVNTPSHGYLCIGSDENGYSDAIAIARASNYSYILEGGLVYLEEDADAVKFLNTMEGDI